MSRLIDADAFEVFGYYSQEGTFDDGVRFVLEKIDAMPTIDAIEVVRCKDCKHNSLNRVIGNAFCDLGIGLYQIYDFCSHGERREE